MRIDGHTLGVDLGGTKVLSALVDKEGQILASQRRPTDARKGADAVIEDVVACVRDCLGKAAEDADALGIGIAGQVDTDSGTVTFAPNLGWQDIQLGPRLSSALDVPVVVDNDVRAAAWGEWLYGVAKGVQHLVVVFVGTGIGGAVVSEGRMLDGHSHAAGELGHITLVVEGRKCRCSNYGCLESYAGGWAIAERAQEVVEARPVLGKGLIDLAGSAAEITAQHVAEGYRLDDPLAVRLVEETGVYLAAAAIGFVNTFNPRLLVMGGGVIEGLPELIVMVEAGIQSGALPTARRDVAVVKAALAGTAGVIGAAALARRQAVEPHEL